MTYQFKIVITALLSMVMLHKKLNGYQWLGILLLIPGVSLVQYDSEQHIHHENTVLRIAVILRNRNHYWDSFV